MDIKETAFKTKQNKSVNNDSDYEEAWNVLDEEENCLKRKVKILRHLELRN